MEQREAGRQEPAPETPYFAAKWPPDFRGESPLTGSAGSDMRSVSKASWDLIAVCLAVTVLATGSVARADSRVFIVANQADGYGIDQCLANGETCGAHAARSYCRSRDFAQATSYRRVDPSGITGATPGFARACNRSGCNAYVAITCNR